MDCTQLAKILLYSQITGKNSLRDIEVWLQANANELYHMGIKTYARSTVSYWNNKTDSVCFEKLFYAIIQHYKSACFAVNDPLWIPVVAMDSSVISLALKPFNWATHRTTKWWIKLHVWIDIVDCIPRFVALKEAKIWDNLIAHQIIENNQLKKWEMIVFDRYYIDYNLWEKIDNQQSFFVSRTKTNTDYTIYEDHNVFEEWVIQDATVELTGKKWVEEYWKLLRVVKFYHKEDDKIYTFMTNNHDIPAKTICDIYRNRRKIEEFFRWIKQNLKIKSFLGTAENAVKNQIRIALIYYVLLQYLRSVAKLGKKQLLKMSRFISEKCLSKIGISELFAMCRSKTNQCLSQIWPPQDSLFFKD